MADSPPMFSWLYRNPEETLDRLRAMRRAAEKADEAARARIRRLKSQRIQALTKLAMAGQLKGR